jgi:hypothetical protein
VIDSSDKNKVLLLGRNLSPNNSQLSFTGKIYDFSKYNGNKDTLLEKIAKIKDDGSNLQQVYDELSKEEKNGLVITSDPNLTNLLDKAKNNGFNIGSKGFMETSDGTSYSVKDVVTNANFTTGAGDNFRQAVASTFNLNKDNIKDISKAISKQIPNLVNSIPSAMEDFWSKVPDSIKGNYTGRSLNEYLDNKVTRTGEIFLKEGESDILSNNPSYSALDWYMQNGLFNKNLSLDTLSNKEKTMLTNAGIIDKEFKIQGNNEIVTNYVQEGSSQPVSLKSLLSMYKKLKESAGNNANGFEEFIQSQSNDSKKNIYKLLTSNVI